MFWLAIVFLVLWFGGYFGRVGGNLVHLLLLLFVIAIVIALVERRGGRLF